MKIINQENITKRNVTDIENLEGLSDELFAVLKAGHQFLNEVSYCESHQYCELYEEDLREFVANLEEGNFFFDGENIFTDYSDIEAKDVFYLKDQLTEIIDFMHLNEIDIFRIY